MASSSGITGWAPGWHLWHLQPAAPCWRRRATWFFNGSMIPSQHQFWWGINTIPKLGKGFVDAGRILLSYIKNQTLYHTLMTLIIPYIDDLTLADDLNLAWQILFWHRPGWGSQGRVLMEAKQCCRCGSCTHKWSTWRSGGFPSAWLWLVPMF